LVPDRSSPASATANHPSHREVIVLVVLNFINCLADERRVLNQSDLSQVLFQAKMPRRIVSALVGRQQKSSYQQYEQGACQSHRQSDWSNRENSETRSAGLLKDG